MTIRTAVESDLPQIVAIYNQAVATGTSTADTEPTTVDDRRDWLFNHAADRYPIYVDEATDEIRGWCSLSPYRPGRKALRYTAEISYYVHEDYHRKGVATGLIQYAMEDCSRLQLKTLFGILLETNTASVRLLEKLGFEQWGHMPKVADFEGTECGHVYLGKRIR